MSDIGDDNPFKIYPLSEMPVSSDLHRDFTEEELIEKMDFVPPEHHCSTSYFEDSKLIVFYFGGNYIVHF